MPASIKPCIIYLGRSRLHRMWANLIQTIHTASVFHRLGRKIKVVLPRGRLHENTARTVREIGGDPAVDLTTSWLLRTCLRTASR